MCHLRKLDCYICKMKLMREGQYELLEENSSIYLLQQCRYVAGIVRQKMEEDHNNGSKLEYKGRFHCPNIQWPPDPSSQTRLVCEACLRQGYCEYRLNLHVEKSRRRRQVTTPSNSGSDFSDDNVAKLDRFRHFSETFHLIPSESAKQTVLDLFQKDFDPMIGPEDYRTHAQLKAKLDVAFNRPADGGTLKCLTIYIPRCNLCKTPTVKPEKTVKDNDPVWLGDVEYEPSTMLWHCLGAEACDALHPIECRIKTGFMNKPCSVCIQHELDLRTEVVEFLNKNKRVNWIGWMVFTWLMTRGVGNIPMFEHAAMNVGFPNTKPPGLKEVMGLMAEGWKRATGLGWEHVGELQTPAAYALAVIMHDMPFVSLRQWPEYRPDVPLTIQHTLPNLIGNAPQEFLQGDWDRDDAFDRGKGVRRRTSRIPKKLLQRSQLVSSLKMWPGLLANVRAKTGLPMTDIETVLQEVADGMVVNYRGAVSPGSFHLRHSPIKVQLEDVAEDDVGPDTHIRKKARTEVQPSSNLSVTMQGSGSSKRLLTISGAYIDQESQKAVLKSNSSAGDFGAGPDSVTRKIPHSVQEVPSQQPLLAAELANGGKQKHLQFGEPDDIANKDNNFVGDRLVGDGASGGEHDGEPQMPDLKDDENAVAQCSLGHAHILEAGQVTSAPGELVFLPLGLRHNY